MALTGYFLFGSYINVKKEKHWNFYPSDWFYLQRAFPQKEISFEKYFEAIKVKQQILAKSNFQETWEQIGPANIGGRITALAVNKKENRIIAGAAAGGIFISSDGGKTWQSTSDNFPGLSIGALKTDPNNPNIVYCGTGEANSSGDSYPGFGILKSTDGGLNWINTGLQETHHIAEIEIHPLNGDIIYVAAAGPLHSKDNNRGIYKSTDGGLTWDQVLFISDSTSAIDVAVDPTNVNIVYAAMWERLRSPTFRKVSGFTSGIFKSTNGGISWINLSDGLPAASKYIGRISIAVAPSNPAVIYALYKNSTEKYLSYNFFGGFYKSTNAGLSWIKMPDLKLSSEFSDFGWYFGLIEVDPKDYNKVYLGEIDLLKTTDGGNNWVNITNSYSGSFNSQHPDQHALWIDPENTNYLIAGNDGGIFTSDNGGNSWTKSYNLPITQFYVSTIDYLNPVKKFGGTQDNGTVTSFTGKNDDWEMVFGGDGFYCLVDHSNSNIVYAESQYGGLSKSTDGGKTFYLGAMYGIDYSDRRNWSTPVAMDLIDPKILYYGTYKLYRTTDGAENWNVISPDLTRGANGRMGTITCISANRLSDDSQIVYIGTDDGRIWYAVSPEFNWIEITGNLPLRYITDVCCDSKNPDYVYVTLSGFNRDLSNAHIFKSTNRGNSWVDISGNLPDIPLNSVIADPDNNNVLFVGGDAGVFYTTNSGEEWVVLGKDLPNSPVFDLNYHQPTKILIAATHGRSLYEIDLTGLTNISIRETKTIPFQLNQNFPNPFNPETVISWKQAVTGNAILTLYNSNGEKLGEFLNENFDAGFHSFTFNTSGKFSSLPSGVYICRLQVNKYMLSKKMLLLK
jgi:photosystem II stability/assembly factor-like uncharacterized protein